MKQLIFISLTWLLLFQTAEAQTELRFSSLDSLLNYAEQNSITIKTTEQQVLLAKWQKVSAQAGLRLSKTETPRDRGTSLKTSIKAFGWSATKGCHCTGINK